MACMLFRIVVATLALALAACAQVTDFSDASEDQVGVGTIVTLNDKTAGEEIVYTILGAWDGDPENSIISYKTPLGTNLLSKHVGDEVSVQIDDQDNTFVVKAIRRYVDQK